MDHERKKVYENGRKRVFYYWKCKCDCGNVVVRSGNSLRAGDTTSCGCKKISRNRRNNKGNLKYDTKFKDLTGRRFGKLFVDGLDHKRIAISNKGVKKTYFYWKCSCDCGNNVIRSGETLKKGASTSCGCVKLLKQSLIQKEKRELRQQQNCNIEKDSEEEFE